MKSKVTLGSFLLFILIVFSFNGEAQDYNSTVKNLIKDINAPTIAVAEASKKKMIFLDARELSEFNVSHIKQADFIGYKNFDLQKVVSKYKKQEVIVYCSVGYRSAKIVEQLRNHGVKAYNLFGGIISWKNSGQLLYTNDNKKTQKVHTYDQSWSKWLTSGEAVISN